MKANFTNPITKLISQDLVLNLTDSARKTGRFRDPLIRQHLKFLSINPEDLEIREILIEDLTAAEIEGLENSDPFKATNPYPNDELTGNLGLGFIPPYQKPWLIPTEMLTNNVLVCGRTGGGKTNLILLILAQILEMQRC